MSKDFLMKKTIFNPVVDGKAVAVYGSKGDTIFDGSACIINVHLSNNHVKLIGRFEDETINVDDIESGRVRLVLLEEPAPVEPVPWQDDEPCPFKIGDIWKHNVHGYLSQILDVGHDINRLAIITLKPNSTNVKYEYDFKEFTSDYSFHAKGDK